METPRAPTPDDKNWTWVVTRRCLECGYLGTDLDVAKLPSLIVAIGTAFGAVLTRDDVRRRPSPQVWSPLEYGCHVRDVLQIYDRRLAVMLADDNPLFENWDQDATAIAHRYDLADPANVADDLVSAAGTLATRFATVGNADWQRGGRRSDGATFTIDTFARYFAHDPIHHLHDVGAPMSGEPVG